MNPSEILEHSYELVSQSLHESHVDQPGIQQNIEKATRKSGNSNASVRVLLSCALAKTYNDNFDIRKPYTEIDGDDAFSGRRFDEQYVQPFVKKYELPANSTTAFLTPTFRTKTPLTPEIDWPKRTKTTYAPLLDLLKDVHEKRITARQLLNETIRQLILVRNEKKLRLEEKLLSLKLARSDVPISAEQIITILQQHLATKGASRLPVLIVAAAYATAGPYLRERILPLEAHNAADSQTHSIGDVQVVLESDDNVATCYEMKLKRVTVGDIDLAVQDKLTRTSHTVDNYIFITTDIIEPEVTAYARTMYDTVGIEVVVLDCIGFIRHFLHLFHRHRITYLDAYQELVLAEPESAVSQPVKEVFLTLRQAAESD